MFVDVRSNIEILRLFEIVDNKIVEKESFVKTFVDLLRKEQEKRNLQTDRIIISNFEADFINFNAFDVLFSFEKDSMFDPVIMSFDFKTKLTGEKVLKIATKKLIYQKNPKLKHNMIMIAFDNQVVLLTNRPTFSMICYDDYSYFEFEYIDVLKFIYYDYLYAQDLC